MTDINSRPPLAPRRQLLTLAQVLACLRAERDEHGLSVTARRYGISPQSLWNALDSGKLSKGMVERLGWKIWELYEKKEGTE